MHIKSLYYTPNILCQLYSIKIFFQICRGQLYLNKKIFKLIHMGTRKHIQECLWQWKNKELTTMQISTSRRVNKWVMMMYSSNKILYLGENKLITAIYIIKMNLKISARIKYTWSFKIQLHLCWVQERTR